MEIPDTLRTKIELFRSRGRLFRWEDELFADANWTAVFIGQNIVPETYDPLVDAVDIAAVEATAGRMRDLFRRTAEAMPTHRDFLDRCCATPSPAAAAGVSAQ